MTGEINIHSGKSTTSAKLNPNINPEQTEMLDSHRDFRNQLEASIPDSFKPISKVMRNGSFGTVYLAKINPYYVVTRKISRNNESLEQEANLYKTILHSPYIQRFINFEKLNGWTRLDTDLYAADLEMVIHKGNVIEKQEFDRILYELAAALYHVHEKGWIHNDVKPRNVLLTSNYQVKLGNFDNAVQIGGPPTLKFGSIEYLPPECCEPCIPQDRKDVWAYGVSALQILLGNTFKSAENYETSAKRSNEIAYFGWKDHIKGQNHINRTQVMVDILDMCIVWEHQRSTMHEVLMKIFPMHVKNECWMFDIVMKRWSINVTDCNSATNDRKLDIHAMESNTISHNPIAKQKANDVPQLLDDTYNR